MGLVSSELSKYRLESDYHCEVRKYLSNRQLFSDVAQEVHHIEKRKSERYKNYFTNLIFISRHAHEYGHGVNAANIEVACLYAKLQKHRNSTLYRIQYQDVPDCELHWFVPALDELCLEVSLAARIEVKLLPKLTHDLYRGYAAELIEELSRGAM